MTHRHTRSGLKTTLFALLATAFILPTLPAAAAYPTDTCVALKMGAAAKYCQAHLKAYSKWQKDPAAGASRRDQAITKAEGKFSATWAKADTKSAAKGVDCSQTTYTQAESESDIRTAVLALEAAIAAGVDNDNKNDRVCRSKVTKAASALCAGFLKSESKHLKKRSKDRERVRLSAARAKASSKFSAKLAKAVSKAAAKGTVCDAGNAFAGISGAVDAVGGDVVINTIVSPNLSSTWTMFEPGAAISYPAKYPGVINDLTPSCTHGDQYRYFAKRGTVNNLVVYYQGGGACWDYLSCYLAQTFKATVPASDNPGTNSAAQYGLANLNDPDNPFKDWHSVVVGYCSADVHLGSTYTAYQPGGVIRHLGRHNASVVEKWVRENIVNPDRVFVTGSSAGSIGAFNNSVPLMDYVYPSSRFDVMGDGYVGYVPAGWVTSSLPKWNADLMLKSQYPELFENFATIDRDMAQTVWTATANRFPKNRFSMFTAAYDGLSGQVQFYQAMNNPTDVLAWLDWWVPTCEVNTGLTNILHGTSNDASNFRYYIGAGSRHTAYGSDKVYADTSGGVGITVVDWLNDQLYADDAQWSNIECVDCNPIATCQGGDNRGMSCASNGDCPGGSCEADSLGNGPPYLVDGTIDCT